MTIQRFCSDDETGEILIYNVNEETGEPFIENNYHSKKSNIAMKQMNNYKYLRFPKGSVCESKKFQSLKEEILSGSNKINHWLFLIPTLLIFPAYMCTLLMILEVFLHVRCHIKNRMLKNPDMYYQSPFHLITRTFCGVCRDCDMASKIGHMQDKRRSRYDYFRSIAL